MSFPSSKKAFSQHFTVAPLRLPSGAGLPACAASVTKPPRQSPIAREADSRFAARAQARKPTPPSTRGAASIWIVVILVPVLLGLAGFALDLGMLYSAKGELKTAASAMALASAQNLIGTDTATGNAQAAAMVTVESPGSGPGNQYSFQGLPIGQSSGSLTSTISDPSYYSDAADAIASLTPTGAEVASSQAKYVRQTVTGQIPLIFWSFLPGLSGNRVANVTATAVAGISAPLCLACGIEPFAVAAPSQSDTVDFGLVQGTIYSFAFLCIVSAGSPGVPPAPPPPILGGASSTLNYLLINRFDTTNTVFPDETSQAYQDGAGGMPGNTNQAQACFRINNVEQVWADAAINRCGVPVTLVVTSAVCGLDARFESSPTTACSNVVSIDTLASVYPQDTDVNTYTAYTDYTGNGRRLITIPIVDTLSATAMTVLGFRQFLLLPNSGATDITTGDTYGRFLAMYVGSVAPVPQGRFDGCSISSGPGKVVLHQ